MKSVRKKKLHKKVRYLLFEKDIQFSLPLSFFSHYRYFFLLLFLYVLTRIINLTILPIFTDESLYLRWGWLEVQSNNWFIPLYDGKQPILTWAFGYAQVYFADPLYGARSISIVTGLLTLLGIFKIGTSFFSKKFALIAGLFYIVISVFVFYDRMALMESSISMIGIWSCYLFLSLVRNPKVLTAILLGEVFGIGLFDKSDTGIFLATTGILGGLVGFKYMQRKERKYFFLMLCLSLFFCIFILLPLLMQKNVYNIISDNTRYAYTFPQLFYNFFPILTKNINATFFLLWGYLTPIPFLLSIGGIIYFLRSKEIYSSYSDLQPKRLSKQNNEKYNNRSIYTKLLVGWFLLPLLFFILFTVHPIDRYIVVFLPVTTFFCAYAFLWLAQRFRNNVYHIALFLITFFIPLILTGCLLFSPVTYFSLLHIFTPVVDPGYTQIPSGYGIPETRNYLLQLAKNEAIAVYVQEGSGNPEDAIYDYLGEKPIHNITVLSTFQNTACSQPQIFYTKSYFISEGDSINTSCMINLKKFYRPIGKTFVGVYQITPH